MLCTAEKRACICLQVLSLSPSTVDQALGDIIRVADAAGVSERGKVLTQALQKRLDDLRAITAPLAAQHAPRVLHLEWLEPPMPAGEVRAIVLQSRWDCSISHPTNSPHKSWILIALDT